MKKNLSELSRKLRKFEIEIEKKINILFDIINELKAEWLKGCWFILSLTIWIGLSLMSSVIIVGILFVLLELLLNFQIAENTLIITTVVLTPITLSASSNTFLDTLNKQNKTNY